MRTRNTSPRQALLWTTTPVYSPFPHPSTLTFSHYRSTSVAYLTTCLQTDRSGLVRSTLISAVTQVRYISSSITLVRRRVKDSTSSTGRLSCTHATCIHRPRMLTLGVHFSQRFYSVFDTTNGRVGFATTQYTNSTTN